MPRTARTSLTRLGAVLLALALSVGLAAAQPPAQAPAPSAALPAQAGLSAPDPGVVTQVGPGDVLELIVPGYPEFSRPYPVSRAGEIVVDLVGVVPVAGLTPAQVAERLRERLSFYLRRPEGIAVRVLARQMFIQVSGHVAQPGLRLVPASANLQEVLTHAGGALPGALMTRILIRRTRDGLVEEIPVDLKAYLEGQGTLPALQNGDEVFVRRVETAGGVERPLTAADVAGGGRRGTVTIVGAVRQPGELLLSAGTSLLAALTAAGGPTELADLSQIRRVPGGVGEAQVIDLARYLEQGGALPRVAPGDVITVPSRLAGALAVQVLGAVNQPGPVMLPPGADLQVALRAAGGAQPLADTRRIQITRREGELETTREVDLEAYLRTGDRRLLPPLRAGDVIMVPKGARGVAETVPMVFVQGAVAQPGPVPLVENRALLYALFQARPLLSADLTRVRIIRADAEAGAPGEPAGARVETFDLRAYQAGSPTPLPELQPGDVIVLDPLRVTVMGAVAQPGLKELPSGATLIDALAVAGGPTAMGDLKRVVLSRTGPAGPERQVINLEQYVYEPEQAPPLPPIQAGDVITVEESPVEQRVVYVLGQVARPGPVLVTGPSASLLQVLTQAGGLLPTADQGAIRIVSTAGGETTGQVQYDLARFQRGEAGAAPPPVRPGDVVVVGDVSQPGRGVLMIGAVQKQGWTPIAAQGQTVLDTVGMAGGLLPVADWSRVSLTRAGGETTVLNLANASRQGQPTPEVRDGDTIVIGYRREGRSFFDEILRYLPIVGWFLD